MTVLALPSSRFHPLELALELRVLVGKLVLRRTRRSSFLNVTVFEPDERRGGVLPALLDELLAVTEALAPRAREHAILGADAVSAVLGEPRPRATQLLE
jgi:hypothetical protein